MSKAHSREALRTVAQMVYDRKPGPYSAGLCHAATQMLGHRSWEDMCATIRMIRRYMGPNQSWLAKPGTKWDQRAMFALLVAEAEKK